MLSVLGDEITEIASDIKYFFVNNSHNPFLWVGIIVVALIIFELVYNALKDKD